MSHLIHFCNIGGPPLRIHSGPESIVNCCHFGFKVIRQPSSNVAL